MALRTPTTLAASLALLSACAGYRGGWESLPYIGAMPPAAGVNVTADEARLRRELVLPGLRLRVNLNNAVRTHDTQVYAGVLPLGIDPRAVPLQPAQPGLTQLTLSVWPQGGRSFLLRPARARLSVGGQTVAAQAVSVWGQWNEAGEPVERGGRYADRPLSGEPLLEARDRPHVLTLTFPIERPSPQDGDIVLELDEALSSPGTPAIPRIRFQPSRWTEGYN